jgi:hypothetical protein
VIREDLEIGTDSATELGIAQQDPAIWNNNLFFKYEHFWDGP